MENKTNSETIRRLRKEKMQMFGNIQEELYRVDLDSLRKIQSVFEREAIARFHSASITNTAELQELASLVKGANQFLNWINNCKVILNKTMEG